MSQRWNRVKALFAATRDLDERGREAFLDSHACEADTATREDVRSLLAAHGAAGAAFLDPPALDELDGAMREMTDEGRVGARVGPYLLVECIATGGMGAVYRATRDDDVYRKQVAIKILRRGADTPDLRRRLRRERQTLAELEHPNITRLLDGGTTDDGQPYLVMEFVEGTSIDRYCDGKCLSIDERLDLFMTVCTAVRHAHQHLVVHRDLKPSNILVTHDGHVKLVDFGIARLLEPSSGSETMTRQALTPAYASPEQVRGESVNTASDVYSLSVVMYELLCGVRPFKVDGLPRYEAERAICETDPITPASRINGGSPATAAARSESMRRLARRLRGDLETIVMTGLQKDVARRYASVEQLEADVRRYRRGEPIHARRDALGYRTLKFVVRHKAGAVAALVVLLALVGSLATVSTSLVRVSDERNTARGAEVAARETLEFYQAMLAAANPYRGGRAANVVEIMNEAAERLEDEEGAHPALEAGVRLAIGRSSAALMRWQPAREQLERCEALLVAMDRDDPEYLDEYAECLSLLGRALTHTHERRAIRVLRRSVEIRRELYGPSHALVAESTGNLGFAMWSSVPRHRADWEGAEAKYREAIAMVESLGLGESRDAARFTMSLAYMCMHQGRDDEAEQLFRRAAGMYAKFPFVEDLYALTTNACLAEVLERQGRYGEAIEVITTARDTLPSDFDMVRRRNLTWRLAALHLAKGNLDAAERELCAAVAQDCTLIGMPRVAEQLDDADGCAAALEAMGAQRSNIALPRRPHRRATLAALDVTASPRAAAIHACLVRALPQSRSLQVRP